MRVVAVDVDYRGADAVAAAVAFDGFDATTPAEEVTARILGVAPYEPGSFYRRELPCLRAVIAALRNAPDVVLVDGYVWLAPGVPGLGARLHDALGCPVIGLAKTRYRGATHALEVRRGASHAPLFVTAAGLDAAVAAAHVAAMAGPYRLPTLVKRADALCRTAP
jgi:deoxyribonuclease V